jgi:hypothetical protein
VIAALAGAFPDDPPTFLARVPHGYHDEELIAADLASAGFDDVQIETVELECTGKRANDLAHGYCRGTPLRGEIEARGPLDATTRDVAVALERRFGTGPVLGRMSALVVSGRAPDSATVNQR